MSINETSFGTYGLECDADEILLVQATGHDGWFLDALDVLDIEWEAIAGVPRWIQFEIPTSKLQVLMYHYPDVTIDILG